jgi:hypothetical protein
VPRVSCVWCLVDTEVSSAKGELCVVFSGYKVSSAKGELCVVFSAYRSEQCQG